jgi:hypothetical protein
VAGAAFWCCRRGLADVEDLDAAVGPLPDLDGHVLRAEGGAAHDDPAVLLVDQVALQPCKKSRRRRSRDVSETEAEVEVEVSAGLLFTFHLEERPPDPLVAPVAVDAHPQGHDAVGLLLSTWYTSLPLDVSALENHFARTDWQNVIEHSPCSSPWRLVEERRDDDDDEIGFHLV